jgi:hypothetical protein
LINAMVALLVRRGYLAPVANDQGSYVLMRAPDTLRIQTLVTELLREGGGHPEVDVNLQLDDSLKETMARLESGLVQGFGDQTLAHMVADAPALTSQAES